MRDNFHIPVQDGKEVVYLCGNSLGLQPKNTRGEIDFQLNKWRSEGVEGHFSDHDPWYNLAESLKPSLARLVGATPDEVAAMGSLSTNLHLLMASFYRPKGKKKKILIEKNAFPSDRYIAQSQIQWHGGQPSEDLIQFAGNEHNILDENELCDLLHEKKDEIALVLLPGVQFHSGQVLDMEKIAEVCRANDIICGFDLAHAAGNVILKLHEWGVDFASWCHYKYVNAGPGAIAGIFVHVKHGEDRNLPRLSGWWGYPADTRFLMEDEFIPAKGADGWVQSNPDVLSLAALKAALKWFDEYGMTTLRAKSEQLTTQLIDILQKYDAFEIITPQDPAKRGCQVSFRVKEGKPFFDKLLANGVIGDWRVPDIIRLAPAPLYNDMQDLDRLANIIDHLIPTAVDTKR